MPQKQSSEPQKKGATKPVGSRTAAKRPSMPPQYPQQILQRALDAPQSVSREELLHAQSVLGNRVMRQVLTGNNGGTGKGERPLSKSLQPTNLLQRRMGGTRGNVQALGGGVSLKGGWGFGRKGGLYKQVLKGLETYEQAEVGGTQDPSQLNSIFDSASSWLDKESHISSMGLENEEALGRSRAMGYTMGKIAREQGRFGNELLPVSSRPSITLYMGQGIVGYLGQYILHSTQFSSCAPIVMFNSNTGIGGLYHFPGGAAKSLGYTQPNSHLAFLLAMGEAVEPTDIYVHSGATSIEQESYDFVMEKEESARFRGHRRLLMADLAQYFAGSNIHEGIGQGTISVTLNSDGTALDQHTNDWSSGGGYDLAKVAPPNDVLRFGAADAGVVWMSNYDLSSPY